MSQKAERQEPVRLHHLDFRQRKKSLQTVGVNLPEVWLHCSFPSRPLGGATGGAALQLSQQLAGAAHVPDGLDQRLLERRWRREVKVAVGGSVSGCVRGCAPAAG